MNLEKRNKIDNRILAGDGLYYKFKNRSYSCSAGFWARSQPNMNYIATTGHCYVPGSGPFYLLPWNSTRVYLIGEMPIHYLEPIDFGLINIDIKKIQPIPSVRNTDSERYKELFIEDVILASNNGAHLCLSGLRSHVKCGYVAALNGFTSNGLYFRDNIFVVNLRNIAGDSGGPIFYYKNFTHVSLNGIVQGGLFDFNDNINGITGVITISSILNLFEDLEVVTTS
ncbi:S1 family peptidase [Gigaspora margarita]|uniref:S1 family peptidase n=1 Tax=Gigaspora margarita TaxID=4874 RepID=A0A8H4EQS3_GIGMA|nr:S1 family peptidase [Gigaspora margarita]